jgi:UDP-2,3-diacylglucosamine pyrophosphatase LpxH
MQVTMRTGFDTAARNGVEKHHDIIVMSDMHLGMRSGGTDRMESFLRKINCNTLVLNGDIIDGIHIDFFAPQPLPHRQHRIIDALNDLAARGTKIIYIPGNHDAKLRGMDLHGKTLMGVTIMDEYMHETPQEKKFLICHGDHFDKGLEKLTALPQWIQRTGVALQAAALLTSTAIDNMAESLLRKNFHLAASIRRGVESAFGFKNDFMETALQYARDRGFDGIICGHTHKPGVHVAKDGIVYANSGDWVENFTALGLDETGTWNVLRGRRDMSVIQSGPVRPQTQAMTNVIACLWPGRCLLPRPAQISAPAE